jgi:hypothetical protein
MGSPAGNAALRPAVVEAEDRFDTTVQLVGQMDAPDAPAIRAARVLEPLQINPESVIELRHRTRKDDGATAGMLLNNREAVRGGKFADGLDVGSTGAELFLEFLAREMTASLPAPGEAGYRLFQFVCITAAENHADLQPLGRIGLAGRTGSVQGFSLAPLQWMSCHFH